LLSLVGREINMDLDAGLPADVLARPSAKGQRLKKSSRKVSEHYNIRLSR